MKLGETVRAIKEMTHNDNGPGIGRNYGETAVFIFGWKTFFALKSFFFYFFNKNPKFT